MRDPLKLDHETFQSLLPYVPVVGATEAFPTKFPGGFASVGANPRDRQWNAYLGLTTSHPDPGTFVFGLAYDDLIGRATDEDIFAVDVFRRELTRHYKGHWEKIDPRYRHTHRGSKDYLRFAL